MLLGIPGAPPKLSGPYPKPPPEGPRAVVLFSCMTNAKPSAVGFVPGVIWNVKSVVNVSMLAATWYHAADASFCPPSVSSRKEPFSFVLPTRFIPPPAKPAEKLMLVAPPKSIVYRPLLTGLLLRLVAAAIAESVSVAATEMGPVYFVLVVVGAEPSV